MKLSNVIFENDFGGYAKFKKESEKLKAELEDTYNRDDIDVTIGQYSGRDRGFGQIKVRIDPTDTLPDAIYNNMKSTLKAKGYEITGGMNFGEIEDERITYPNIKFEFDIVG